MGSGHGHMWQRAPRATQDATSAEQFSIWAMRLWWSGFPELDAAWPDLVRGFRACSVPSALEACHRFCTVTLSAAGCGDGIACLYCPRIATVEEALLASRSTAASSNYLDVESHLRRIMPDSAARLAAPHAMRFARHLDGAGLRWPVPAVSRIDMHTFSAVPAIDDASDRIH
jgi:hypothetical protein